jgi:hypothetical protein
MMGCVALARHKVGALHFSSVQSGRCEVYLAELEVNSLQPAETPSATV